MNYFLFHKGKGRCAPFPKRPKRIILCTPPILTKFLLVLAVFLSVQLFSELKAQTVSLDLNNASFIKATEAISKQTKYDFSYNDRILKKTKPVTLKLTNEPLTSALKKLFATQPFTYEIRDGVIIIYDLKSDIVSPSTGSDSPVKGKVTTQDGKTLEGVTIKVKGIDYHTRTDQNGNFLIPGKYANEILEIRMVGYTTQEVGAQRARVVTLAMQVSDLNEVNVVVKTGYQDIDRRKLTSSVTTIKMDDILTPGINTIDKLLEGRVPGMIFMQNSGQAGAAPKLRVRGTSTILGNREPLWVLDGIVLADPVNVDPAQINDLDFVNLLGNAIAGLNPEDIEQIDVLKDASATALYGAKAGNGVIVITTKKGKAGKPVISYSMTSGFARRPRYSDRSMYMMNSAERMDVSKEMVERKMQYNSVTQWSGYEAVLQNYYAGHISYDEFKRQSDYYAGVNTDWMGLLTRDAFSQNHTLSLSGGSQDVKYYSSIGYQNENGVISSENNKRYSTMMNITANYKKFMAQISFTGNYSVRNYVPADLAIMNYAYNTSRTIPAFNADGSLFYYPRTNGFFNYNYNILNERDNSNDHSQGIGANVKGVLRYKVFRGLDLEGIFAYGLTNTNRETYYTKDSFYIFKLRADQSARDDMAPIGGELTKNETTNNNYTARLQANYTTTLGEASKHALAFAAGMEAKSSEYKGFSIVRRGYFPELGGYFDYVSSTNNTGYYQKWMQDKRALGSFDRTLTNELAWYGTGGYSWDNRYMLNVHIRGEQSNLFGRRSNNRFLPIWAVSGRWNMKKDIAENASWVNDLALKGSWGWQGNMLPGQAANMVIQQVSGTNMYYNEQYANIKNFPNPDLRWERTSSSNAELEFSLFGAKLNGSIGFFYKKTEDAFLNKVVSEINGVQSYVINSGTLENKGVELAFRITAIDNTGVNKSRRGFVWRIDPQLGQVLNKVLNNVINNRNNVLLDNVSYANFLDGSIQLAGKPINTFYSYRFKGLSSVDGSPIFYGAEPELADQYRTRYSKMNKEDVYLAVMSESGRREPFIQGGISNYFGFGNFGLSFNVTYSLGNKIRMLKIASGYGTNIAYPQQNLRKEFVYRWRRPGDEAYTNIPGLQANNFINQPWWTVYPASQYQFGGSVYDMYDNSDLRLVSANHVKLQSAAFRYNVPEAFAKRLGLGSAYLSVTGTNLFVLCNKMLKGQDPAQSGSSPNINLSVRPTYAGSIYVSF